MTFHTITGRRRALGEVLFLAGLGAAAGFINGLLGTGGGILLVLAFGRAASRGADNRAVSLPMTKRDCYANALCVMLPISLFSALRYIAAGTVNPAAFSPFIPPSILGGILGGVLLDRLKVSWLRMLFSLLIVISGVFMIFRR
jgi:uncharacterized membrane protein YfcA